jgi:hypothetical protein
MLFDPIACGDSHLPSSPHVMLPRHPRMLLAGIQRSGVSGGFETRPYGFFGAARRAAAGYLSLLVQRKVTQRKHAPEPPTPPALLAEGGACQTAHPCAAGRFALPARTALTRGLIRLRLRCSAAATGPDVKSNILKACAARTLLGFWFSAPSELAEHRSARRAIGCAFFWLLFFAQAKKSNPPAAREPHLSFSSIAAGDPKRNSSVGGPRHLDAEDAYS